MCILVNNYLIKKSNVYSHIYDILGEMFKLLPIPCETGTYPSNHTQWRYFSQTLYTEICLRFFLSLKLPQALKFRNIFCTP